MIVTISVIKHAFLVPKCSNRDHCNLDRKRGKYLITYSFCFGTSDECLGCPNRGFTQGGGPTRGLIIHDTASAVYIPRGHFWCDGETLGK